MESKKQCLGGIRLEALKNRFGLYACPKEGIMECPLNVQ